MERIERLTSHLTANPTFSVFEDKNADDIGLDAYSLYNVKDKVCVVTGGSRVINISIFYL